MRLLLHEVIWALHQSVDQMKLPRHNSHLKKLCRVIALASEALALASLPALGTKAKFTQALDIISRLTSEEPRLIGDFFPVLAELLVDGSLRGSEGADEEDEATAKVRNSQCYPLDRHRWLCSHSLLVD